MSVPNIARRFVRAGQRIAQASRTIEPGKGGGFRLAPDDRGRRPHSGSPPRQPGSSIAYVSAAHRIADA
eukprot:3437561-Rhodomonas_salina.5